LEQGPFIDQELSAQRMQRPDNLPERMASILLDTGMDQDSPDVCVLWQLHESHSVLSIARPLHMHLRL